MTLPIPAYDGDPQTLQFILDVIAKSATDTGGRSIKLRWGSATIAWPGASPVATNTNVSHGLGSAPVAVLASMASTAPWSVAQPGVFTATQFTLGVRTFDGTSPAAASYTAYWIAIG